jgi:hypothetical protein
VSSESPRPTASACAEFAVGAGGIGGNSAASRHQSRWPHHGRRRQVGLRHTTVNTGAGALPAPTTRSPSSITAHQRRPGCLFVTIGATGSFALASPVTPAARPGCLPEFGRTMGDLPPPVRRRRDDSERHRLQRPGDQAMSGRKRGVALGASGLAALALARPRSPSRLPGPTTTWRALYGGAKQPAMPTPSTGHRSPLAGVPRRDVRGQQRLLAAGPKYKRFLPVLSKD